MKKNKKWFTFTIITVLLLLLVNGCASKPETSETPAKTDQPEESKYENTTIKIGFLHSDGHPGQLGLVKFKELLEAETGGAVKVDLYGNAILGDARQMNQQLTMGDITAVLANMSDYAFADPAAHIESLAFLFADLESAWKAYDGEFGKAMDEKFIKPQGHTLINWWTNGVRHMTNNVRPINTPADVVGVKFRVPQSDYSIKMFQALGTTPVPLSYSELFTAMQQGTVDGQENGLAGIYASKYQEVQKYLSLTGHQYNSNPFVFNTEIWEKYSPNLQEAIKKCADGAMMYQREQQKIQEVEILQKLKDEGMEVNEVADKQAFMDAETVVWDEYKENFGSELVDLAISSQN